MHIKIKELPTSIQNVLSSVGYHKPDIGVSVSATVSPCNSGSDGQRAFFIAVNISNGEIVKSLLGSWGGANMFNKSNVVDLDTNSYPIPDGIAVVEGSTGHHVFANVVVSQSSVFPQLTSSVVVSDDEKKVLSIYCSYKPSYRKEYLYGSYGKKVFTEQEVKDINLSLQAKGLIKINKIGAVSVTTEGKNIE